MGTGSFPGVKSGQGMTLTPHPLLVPLVMKDYSYTPTPPMGRTACTEPQCLYKSAPYLFFYPLYTNSPPNMGGHFLQTHIPHFPYILKSMTSFEHKYAFQ